MSSITTLGSANSAWSAASSQRADRPPGGSGAAAFKDKLFAKLDADGSGGVDATELQTLLDKLGATTGQSVGGSDAAATFKAMDSNGDGSLAKDELDAGLKKLLAPAADTMAFAQSRGANARSQDLFKKLDSDGNGSIDATELKAGLDAARAAHGKEATSQADVDTLFKKLDSDGSGGISATELAAAKPAQGSGQAAAAAAGPPPGGRPPGGGAGDGDGDGGGKSNSSTAIDPLDTNGDGTVSATERSAGETKAVLKKLLTAIDTNGDQKISRSEMQRFGALLQQVQDGVATTTAAASSGTSSGSSGSSGTSGSSGSSGTPAKMVDFQKLADQVLRHYAQAAASTSASALGSSLSVAA
jgi:Ca2+-binding EF-hand superfamily protein